MSGDGAAGPAVVRAVGLSREHGRGAARRWILDAVDLDVAAGEIVAVVGASGSGKSTLLQLLGGLDRPSAGSVAIAGTEITAMSERHLAVFRRRAIGFVFQSFRLIPELTARENVLMPARLAGDPSAGAQRADALLDRLGVDRIGNQLPGDLSGGEQQRVAIARALVMEPALVLADEPTGNLDARAGAEVLELLIEAASPERAVVLVTHDDAQARRADRVVRIQDGRLTG